MTVSMGMDVAGGRDQDSDRNSRTPRLDVSLGAKSIALRLVRLELSVHLVLDQDLVRVFAGAHQRQAMKPGDRIVAEPPKGVGASLKIMYRLP
jgi:S-adenosylmethionine:diacylglycerol 3-amino-3-carboxypropyl transferase